MKCIVTILLSAPSCILLLLLDSTAHAFASATGIIAFSHHRPTLSSSSSSLYSSEVAAAATTTESCSDAAIQIDPKEAVKLFGRLAEKYISEWYVDDCTLHCLLFCESCTSHLLLSNFTHVNKYYINFASRSYDQLVLDASAGMCCYSACSGKIVSLGIFVLPLNNEGYEQE